MKANKQKAGQGTDYNAVVHLQKDNHESSGKPDNQNESYNIRKQALGPNAKRGR